MVVISIISLLSSVVLASVTAAREKARDVAALQTIREYEKAFIQFSLDNNKYPPGGNPTIRCMGIFDITCTYFGWTFSNATNETDDLGNYLAPYFPTMPYVDTGSIRVGGTEWRGATYNCGAYDGSPPYYCYAPVIFWSTHGTTCKYGTRHSTDGINSVCSTALPPIPY